MNTVQLKVLYREWQTNMDIYLACDFRLRKDKTLLYPDQQRLKEIRLDKDIHMKQFEALFYKHFGHHQFDKEFS